MALQFPPVNRDVIYATRIGLVRGQVAPGVFQRDLPDPFYVMGPRGTMPGMPQAMSVMLANRVNLANTQAKDVRTEAITLGLSAGRLSGVSRDSTGAPLGLCTVMIFETQRRLLVAELTSDAAGAWAIDMMPGLGPFFYVEYLVGSPDRAGTSINTNVPTALY